MIDAEYRDHLKEVIEILEPHRKKEETLNRLFIKHIRARRDIYGDDFVNSAPWLKKNLQITLEHRSTEQLMPHIEELREKEPYRDDTPLVIVRYRGTDCLIDGGKRISKWHRDSHEGPHPVYVLTVLEE